MTNDLSNLLANANGRRILLVGDFMLDQYVFGDAERISPEAPVPVLRIVDRQERVGGAGSVAMNVVTLGARVTCFGIVGDDVAGACVRRMLNDAGADTAGLVTVRDRPTITKTRLTGLAEHRHRQQILRLDDEVVRPLAGEDAKRMRGAIVAAIGAADVVCLEDYEKGLLTPELCAEVIAAARRAGKPVLVDPSRGGEWQKYRGATVLTPNRAEFEAAVGRRVADGELAAAASALILANEFAALVITLGRDGALLVRADGTAERFPTTPRAVYDNTGAGDAVLAMMAVAIAAGATHEQAVALANIAGGLEVQKFGCVPITRDEVLHELTHGAASSRGKLRTISELRGELDARRLRGETVVFTNGVFDILHPGHVELLEKAKQFGSILVVGVNSDKSAKQQSKGDDRPFRDERARVRMLAALQSVDFVVLFDDVRVDETVKAVSPEVLVKGSEVLTDGRGVHGAEHVIARGGRVEIVQILEGWSTTGEVGRIRGGKS